MNTDEAAKKVQDWFDKYGRAGLVLPDGWYGRPGDSYDKLIFLAARPSRLIIELELEWLLVFTGLKSLDILEDDSLMFSDFDHLVFETPFKVTTYDHGEVMFKPSSFK